MIRNSNSKLLFIYLIFAAFICFVSSTYINTRGVNNLRKSFYFNNTKLISDNLIEIEIDPENKVHCKAKEDLFNKQITIKVPKEFILCSCKNNI